MSGINHPVFYALTMLIVGLGIPIFAALNGGLGARLHSPALAAVIALCTGIVVALSFLLISEGLPSLPSDKTIPLYLYFGGVFVVIYILGITWVAPRFGVGNAVAFVLLGQLISMALIDHFGLFAAQHHPITLTRVCGLVLMAAGVFLSVRR